MKKIASFLRNELFQHAVSVIYFLVLIGECFILSEKYYAHYEYRIFTRPALLPILLFAFLMQIISRNHLLIIFAMASAWTADYLTISTEVYKQWWGLGLYGLSFVFYAIQYFQLEWFSFRNGKLALFISLGGLLGFIGGFEYLKITRDVFVTNLNYIFLYATCLALLSYSILYVFTNNKTFDFRFALIALILLFCSNMIFEVSCFVLHRKYHIIDSVSAFCYGTYTFLLVRGTLRVKYKIDGADYFNRGE